MSELSRDLRRLEREAAEAAAQEPQTDEERHAELDAEEEEFNKHIEPYNPEYPWA